MALFNLIKDSLSDLLFPPACLCCGRPLVVEEKLLCLACVQSLPKTNFHQMQENPVLEKFKGRLSVNRATSFMYFTKKGKLQNLIHQLKYKGKPEIGVFLGALFAEDLARSEWLDSVDYILPVPIHRKKRRVRGYNQAAMIAKGISQYTDLPILPKQTLIRIKHTESQTQKHGLDRLNNVKGVFSLKQAPILKGEHVLIVDDVLTTGATLESCALEVLKGHPSAISLATLAIASDT